MYTRHDDRTVDQFLKPGSRKPRFMDVLSNVCIDLSPATTVNVAYMRMSIEVFAVQRHNLLASFRRRHLTQLHHRHNKIKPPPSTSPTRSRSHSVQTPASLPPAPSYPTISDAASLHHAGKIRGLARQRHGSKARRPWFAKDVSFRSRRTRLVLVRQPS